MVNIYFLCIMFIVFVFKDICSIGRSLGDWCRFKIYPLWLDIGPQSTDGCWIENQIIMSNLSFACIVERF